MQLSTINPKLPSKENSIEIMWKVGSALIIISTIFIFSIRTRADSDLWGHLRFGLDMLEISDVMQTDPYSYLNEGQRWINHEWLAEVIFGLTWIVGKSTGLLLLNFGISSLTLILAFIHLSGLGIKPMRITILLFLAVILLSPSILAIRPQMFTYLLFVIIMIIIYRAEEGNLGLLWFAPLVMIVWANLHGGFLAGLGILISWGFLHLIFHRHLWKRVIPPVLISIIATFINPYGKDLLIFLLRTATVSRPEILDWQPLTINSFLGVIYLLSIIISVIGLVFSRRKRSVVLILLSSILILLPMIAIRHLQLIAIAVFIITGEHIWNSWDRLWPKVDRKKQSSIWVAVLPFLTCVVIIFLAMPTFNEIAIGVDDSRYPVDNVSLLKQADVAGNLVIDFNWGEYVIWHLGPKVKVSMDGRRETVYSDEIYEKYINYHNGTGNWDALLTDYKTDMVLVDKATATYNLLLLKADWYLVNDDKVSALFVPKDSPLTNLLQLAATNFIEPSETNNFP